jgi:HAE1 family hydrophobic/amphiphilic exporter-1
VAVPGPQGLKERVVDGTLRLGLDDAIQLTLLNSTDVRLSYLGFEDAGYSALGARRTFDAVATTSFSNTRALSPSASLAEGVPTLINGDQGANFGFSQTLTFGTRYDLSFNATRSNTNDRSIDRNPLYRSGLTLRLTQPLIGPSSPTAVRARVLRADIGLKESRSTLEDQLSRSIVDAVDAYWSAVQEREGLKVARDSMELAEATYQRDKRALELGALPPLEIYRSESTVANRRLQVIESEYSLKRALNRLARLIGADRDPEIAAAPIELTETPTPAGSLMSVEVDQALERARARRPELEALRQEVAGTETSLKVARSGVRPDVSVSGFYTTNGLGGNFLDPTTDPPTIISRGGLSQALDQLRSLDYQTYGFTVSVNLPVRNRGAQADLGQALVAQRRAAYRLKEQEQVVILDVRSAIDDLEKAKLSLSVATQARDLARKTLEAEQRKRELGENTLFLVLEAQAGLATAELSLVRAGVEYQRAVTAVARATGTLLEQHRVEIAGPSR